MKIIVTEILLFSLLIVAFANLTLSNNVLTLSQSKQELTQGDSFVNALNEANGKETINKRKLTVNELSDIKAFQKLNNLSLWAFISTLIAFVFVTTFIVARRNELMLNQSNTSLYVLAISWLMIFVSYYLFIFWEHQEISSYYSEVTGLWETDRTYYLFSGAGFSPTIYFSIVWISKNLLTVFCLFINQKNKDSKKYSLIKRLCLTDLILGNLIILCIHDSFADCYTILDFRMNKLE